MFLLVCYYRYDCREEIETTENERVDDTDNDSDEETEETKQGNPCLRSVGVSFPEPYDDSSRTRFLLSDTK